jgi:membrane protein
MVATSVGDAVDATPVMESAWRRVRLDAHLAWRATGRGIIEFYRSSNLTFASSIAYFSLLSFFPFMILVLSLLSRVASGQAADDGAMLELVQRGLPRNFEFLSTQILELRRAPVPLTILGTLLTIWASMGVFGALTSAVNHAWGTDKPYTYFKHKLIAFVMMTVAGLLFVGILLLKGAIQASRSGAAPWVDLWFPWLPDLTGFAVRNASVPVAVLALGLIYYFAPNTRVRLRDVWYGAVLAAVLWRLALAGFSWYVTGYSRFTVFGQVGTVVVFLVWVYLSAVILLYGVEVTAAYARLRQEVNKGN